MSISDSSVLLKAGTNEVEFIEFYVGGQSYGINVAKVKQVLPWNPKDMTRLDQSDPRILGTYYFRNKPILVIDLRKALKIQNEPANAERQLLLVTEFNMNITGFLVDGVQQIHRKTWKDFHAMSDVIQEQASYIVGNVIVDKKIIMIIDFEHLLEQVAPQHLPTMEKHEVLKKKVERRDVMIVYAEDSAVIRKITTQKLLEAGFTNLKIFENGALALEHLKKIKEKIDSDQKINQFVSIVMSDIEMPQLDGLTLCRQIKTDLGMKELPVVIYSSLINEQMAEKCRSVGADAYMNKPNIHEIAAVIDKFCLNKS